MSPKNVNQTKHGKIKVVNVTIDQINYGYKITMWKLI